MPEGLEEIWKRSAARYESRNQANRVRTQVVPLPQGSGASPPRSV
jgi:hypothetical protein